MRYSNSFKTILFLAASLFVLSSCGKDDDDDTGGGGGGTPQLPGYWKGNTTSPGSFTNPLNGLNVLIKSGNTVRIYYSTSQRPLNDTTTSDVIKQDGTYAAGGVDVSINSSQISCIGVRNAEYTDLRGTFKFTDFGITLTQNFVLKK